MTDDNEAIAERLESERALLLNIDALRGGVDLLADAVRLETGTLHRRVNDLVARMGQFEKFALRLSKVIDELEMDQRKADWWRQAGPDNELSND
jgi:hypothetical protein